MRPVFARRRDRGVVRLHAFLFRQIGPHGIEGGVVGALLDEHSHDGQLAGGGLVYEVHLHREVPAFYCVLARVVEVILNERVAIFRDCQRVPAL